MMDGRDGRRDREREREASALTKCRRALMHGRTDGRSERSLGSTKNAGVR